MDVMSLETSAANIPGILSVTEMTVSYAYSALAANPAATSNATIKTLKARHHKAAKLVAAGFRVQDVARKTGYAAGTIQTFKSNPAFKELVDHYSGEFEETVGELHDRMEALTLDLIGAVEEKLEEGNDDISLGELKDLLTMFLDRTGNSPIKRVEKHSVSENYNASIIQQVRSVAAEKRYDSGGGSPQYAELPMSPSNGAGVGGVEIQGTLAKGSGTNPQPEEGVGV